MVGEYPELPSAPAQILQSQKRFRDSFREGSNAENTWLYFEGGGRGHMKELGSHWTLIKKKTDSLFRASRRN